MKLLELEPRWCLGRQWDDANGTQHFVLYDKATERRGMGMTFLCPVHKNHRLAVFFANPIDGLPPDVTAKYRWHRDGQTFDDITLGPSIDASGNQADVNPQAVGMIQTPCWHGFIRNGQIE